MSILRAYGLVVANGKGGVGKTKVSTNLAVEEAEYVTSGGARPWRHVVLVDLDPQSNAGSDLGITDHDDGQSFLAAALGLADGGPVLYDTHRPNLYYVAGGSKLTDLITLSLVRESGNPRAIGTTCAKALSSLADGETLFVFDTPPSAGSPAADAALLLATHLLIPTKLDERSIEGVAPLMGRVMELQAPIQPLGVVLFGVDPKATGIRQQAADTLAEGLEGIMPLLESSIRHALKAEIDQRQLGVTATEYGRMAEQNTTAWYKQLHLPKDQRISFPSNAIPLADDYRHLHAEVFAAMLRPAHAQPSTAPTEVVDLRFEPRFSSPLGEQR